MNGRYYDWDKTLSYDADVTMVVGARGVGKTFGLRVQFIRDWIKDGSRFVEITRYKSEIPDVARNYFDRMTELGMFPEYVFRTDGKTAYIAVKPEDSDGKPDWRVIGYFVSLTEMQKTKKRTFTNVRRLLLDEATVDMSDRYHGYLSHEFELLANIVDSCTRERSDDVAKRRPHVYLLSNACDLVNPYFVRYGVDSVPPEGYSWYGGKTFLLHYLRDAAYAETKRTDTVAGRMLQGTAEERVASFNDFGNGHTDFVEPKPPYCDFYFGFIWRSARFGVWYDQLSGNFWITGKIPHNTHAPVFALSRADNRINLMMVKRSNKALQQLVDFAMYNQLRFDTVARREQFYEALSLFGIR
jgi:hypothetical protein|nr:MAG TPA: DNA encapsidation protein [Bacteriophage sp.]